MDKLHLIVPCHFGVESVLKREIIDLGYEIERVEDGRITFSGNLLAICLSLIHICVAAVRVKDTIKISTKDNIIDGTPDRNTLWSIQTPQAFSTSLVKEAYEKMMQDQEKNITDDAMVVEEYSNFKVKIVEGDYKNIKITTPEDIYIAEMFLKQTQNIV